MAKPRVFISSTFYDLKQVRSDLDRFIREIGYEPVRHERGSIPYGKEEKLEEYCYKEIAGIDILVSIIGGRYGTQSSHGDASVSQVELRTAIKQDKQVFVFVEKNVLAEYRTYQMNKSNDKVKYHYVDNPRVYEFIESLEALPRNNSIQAFESSEDIASYLKEQWAGLFQRFLQEQRRLKEQDIMQGLESTANTLSQLIHFFKEEKQGSDAMVRDIVLSSHPIFERVRKLLGVSHRIFFLSRNELSVLLKSRGFVSVAEENWDGPNEEEWVLERDGKQILLKVSSSLFDAEGRLKPIRQEHWSASLVKQEERSLASPDEEADLPF